jgi:hypothetical protein
VRKKWDVGKTEENIYEEILMWMKQDTELDP